MSICRCGEVSFMNFMIVKESMGKRSTLKWKERSELSLNEWNELWGVRHIYERNVNISGPCTQSGNAEMEKEKTKRIRL